MLLGVVSRTGSPFDAYLTDSVKEMWKQCEPIAEAVNGFDPRSIKYGSKALDVVTALNELSNQSAYTTWYSSSSPGGSTVTCSQAYTNLKSTLGSPAAYESRLNDICVKNGYDATSSAQLADCKTRLESNVQTIMGSTTLSLSTIMSNVLVSQAISDALVQDNPEVAATMLANRAMVNGGVIDSVTNPEWLSTIMAGMLAIILAITPMLLLLVFTPLMGKALTMLFGLWVFITTWQIADVMFLQAGTDEILTAMSEIKNLGLGIDSMQLAPSAAIKAMSVMGSARNSAAQVAVLVAGMFGLSAYGVSAIGQRAMSRLERASDESADKTMTGEGRGRLINDTRSGLAAQETLSTAGMDKMAATSAHADLKEISAASAQVDRLGGNMHDAAMRSGAVQGSSSAGSTLGYESASPGMSGGAAAALSAQTGARHEVGAAQGRELAAQGTGMSVSDMAQLNTSTGEVMQTADSRATMDRAGNAGNQLYGQQRSTHSVERGQQLGRAEGEQQAALAAGMDVRDMSRSRSSVDASASLGHAEGQLDEAGSLGGVQSGQRQIAATSTAENKGHSQAMLNTFGDNAGIKQGVSAMQTESTKQHAVDMQRQHELVDKIQDSLAGDENDARRSLSDASGAQVAGQLNAQGMDGKRVEDTASYDATKHVAHNTGEQQSLEKNGKNAAGFFNREGEIAQQRANAGQEQFNTLSPILGGDQPLARSEAGANVRLGVNKDQADDLHKQNLITATQAASIPADGVGSVDMTIGRNQQGEMASTGAVRTGHSNTHDDSQRLDNSYDVNQGTTLGTPGSAQTVLKNPESLYNFMQEADRRSPGNWINATAREAERSMSDIYSAHNNLSTSKNLSFGGQVGTPSGKGVMGVPASLNASASVVRTNSDSEQRNALYGAYSSQLQRYASENGKDADHLGLTGADKEQYIKRNTASQFATFYDKEFGQANSAAMNEGRSTTLSENAEKQNMKDALQNPRIQEELSRNTLAAPFYQQQQNATPYGAQHNDSNPGARTPTNENQATRPEPQTIYKTKKVSSGEGEPSTASDPDDSGNHPPVTAQAVSSSIPIANTKATDGGKAPK